MPGVVRVMLGRMLDPVPYGRERFDAGEIAGCEMIAQITGAVPIGDRSELKMDMTQLVAYN